MILFVDYEHPEGRDSEVGGKLMAARVRVTYRLQELSGQVCLLQHYSHVTPDLIERYSIRAVFISGNATAPERYDADSLAGLVEVTRQAVAQGTLPMFGFCGGHQFIASALGVALRPLAGGVTFEKGYAPIEITSHHPLLEHVGEQPVFRHAHGLELGQVPEGFDVVARTEVCDTQMIVHRDAPVVGTQFHPEYYTDEHPAGRRLIENFCRWSGANPG